MAADQDQLTGEPKRDSELTTETKELVSEIVGKIKSDSVTQLALRELGKTKRLQEFFKHPAALLFMGFVLTAIIGAGLTTYLQSREWDRQKLAEIEITRIEMKYKLIDDVTKSTAERNSAALGIIRPIMDERLSDKQLEKEMTEPRKIWDRVDFEWGVASQIAEMRISTLVRSAKADSTFATLMEFQKSIASVVNTLKMAPSASRTKTDLHDRVKDYTVKSKTAVEDLVRILNDEVREDISKREP
jgi:hypothetical protein